MHNEEAAKVENGNFVKKYINATIGLAIFLSWGISIGVFYEKLEQQIDLQQSLANRIDRVEQVVEDGRAFRIALQANVENLRVQLNRIELAQDRTRELLEKHIEGGTQKNTLLLGDKL